MEGSNNCVTTIQITPCCGFQFFSPRRYPRRYIIGAEDVSRTAIEANLYPLGHLCGAGRRWINLRVNPFDKNLPPRIHADSPEQMIEPAVRRPHEVAQSLQQWRRADRQQERLGPGPTGQGSNPSP